LDVINVEYFNWISSLWPTRLFVGQLAVRDWLRIPRTHFDWLRILKIHFDWIKISTMDFDWIWNHTIHSDWRIQETYKM